MVAKKRDEELVQAFPPIEAMVTTQGWKVGPRVKSRDLFPVLTERSGLVVSVGGHDSATPKACVSASFESA